jgi:hypothetical protein
MELPGERPRPGKELEPTPLEEKKHPKVERATR